MLHYILRRLLLIPLTLFGMLLLNFAIIQFAPGGPVEQLIGEGDATGRISGNVGSELQTDQGNGDDRTPYRGSRGLDPELIAQLEAQFGFDKPAHQRFFIMLGDYLRFDFGDSFFRGRPVIDLVIEKLPVSISLGLWSTLIIYLISIPLGIKKAVRDGSKFDIWTSTAVIIGYAVPGFLFAVLLVILFAGGTYFSWFPSRGLTSADFDRLSPIGQVLDYFWHLALPVTAMVIGGFAALTMLTKNAFIDEINKDYVITARAKGLDENRILYGHVFRNALILIIAGFPATLVSLLFTGSVLIEVIFSLDGLGLLGFEAVFNRDYPIVFASVYVFGLIGLVLQLVSDIMLHVVDPRIDFETREG